MMYHIVCIRDSAAEVFGQPYAVAANGVAVRSFTDEVARGESPLSKHPEDYELYCVGRYDDSVGLLLPCDRPVLLLRGKDAVAK